MLLKKKAKAQLIWNKWLSRRIVLCNQFKYTPSWIYLVWFEELSDEYLSKEDLFMNKDAERTAQEIAAQRKGRHS